MLLALSARIVIPKLLNYKIRTFVHFDTYNSIFFFTFFSRAEDKIVVDQL